MLSLFVIGGALLISMLLFPFYFLAFLKNRRRDEKEAMFPYLEHFFHLLCITEPATVLISLVVLACFLFGKGNIESLREQVVPLLLVLIVGSIRMITSLVIDMIVSILAINRFILYYHNRKGDKYFKQFFKFIIYFEYLLTVLLALIGFQAYSQRETHWGHQLNDILPVCHFLTTCFISLCTIPYFIARSCIFKKSMERESKTEQCIKYQTILVLSSKLIIYPSCLFWTQLNVGYFPPLLFVHSCVIPFTIESAYLWSNRKDFWKMKRGSTVGPASVYTVSRQNQRAESISK